MKIYFVVVQLLAKLWFKNVDFHREIFNFESSKIENVPAIRLNWKYKYKTWADTILISNQSDPGFLWKAFWKVFYALSTRLDPRSLLLGFKLKLVLAASAGLELSFHYSSYLRFSPAWSIKFSPLISLLSWLFSTWRFRTFSLVEFKYPSQPLRELHFVNAFSH